MKPSEKFTELMINFEGEILKGYLDPAGLLTVGIGHLVDVKTEPYRLNQPITKEESRRLFERDTAWAVKAVNKLARVSLTQNQFDALCSFVFNVGERAFAGSTMLRLLNQGDYKGAALEFPKWNKSQGKVLKGLVRRRAAEKALFEGK